MLGAAASHAAAASTEAGEVVIVSVEDGVDASVAALVGHVLDEQIQVLDVPVEQPPDQDVILVLVVEVDLQQILLLLLVLIIFFNLFLI